MSKNLRKQCSDLGTSISGWRKGRYKDPGGRRMGREGLAVGAEPGRRREQETKSETEVVMICSLGPDKVCEQ